MTDAISAHPPIIASLPPARHSWGPAPGDDPEVENYDSDFSELWQDPKEGMSFGDLLDIVNPLQHIPIVSTIYRMVTGDEIGVGSRLAGGALFGGLPGLVASALVAAYESAEGSTVDSQIASLFGVGEPAGGPANRQIAGPAQATAAASDTGGPPEKRPDPPASAAPGASAPATALFTVRRPAAPLPPAAPAALPGGNGAEAASEAAPAAAPGPAEDARAARAAGDDTAAADRRRIAETLARARAQQAALLLANLSPGGNEAAAAPKGRSRDAAAAASTPRIPPAAPQAGIAPAADKVAARAAAAVEPARPQDPFSAHPFILPPGASPELISRAMEQALSKYEKGLRARGAAR